MNMRLLFITILYFCFSGVLNAACNSPNGDIVVSFVFGAAPPPEPGQTKVNKYGFYTMENNGIIEYHINVVRGQETYVQVACLNGQGTAIAMSNKQYNNSGFGCHSLNTSIATVDTTGITFIKNNAACSYYMKIRGGSKKGETKAQFTSTSATGVCGELFIHVDDEISISSFKRTSLGAGNEKSVTITTYPAQLPAGQSVTLTCERDQGSSGSAIITDLNGNPISTIYRTTTILIRGTSDSWGYGSAAPNNMILKAELNGGTGFWASQYFTVCAHPCNFRAEYKAGSVLGKIGMTVGVGWKSDSQSVTDLDEVSIIEMVKFGVPKQPFMENMTLDAQESMGDALPPRAEDEHGIPWWFDLPATLEHQMYKIKVEQLFVYTCDRCGTMGGCENSGFNIFHCVYYSDSMSSWVYHVYEMGAEVSLSNYSVGAGSANVSGPYIEIEDNNN